MVTQQSTRPINPLLHARHATSVAQSLRDAADAATQPVLRTRLITAATTIDILVELLIASIVKRRQVRPLRGDVQVRS